MLIDEGYGNILVSSEADQSGADTSALVPSLSCAPEAHVYKLSLDVQIVRVKDHVGYYIVDDDGNRTWYPDNDIGDKPLEGCEFVSIDQAYAFYKDYGKRAGFDVRKGGHYKPKPGEDPNLKWFLCSKEGKNPELAADKSKDVISDVSEITMDENVIVKQRRNRGSKGHNHPLVSEKDMIYMKSLRDLGYTKQHFLFQASNAILVLLRVLDSGSMKIAIPECFPYTRTQALYVAFMQKLVSKVGTAICNKTDFKRRICDIVWTDQILPYEFEREYIERKNDHDSRYKNPKLKTDLQMEKEAIDNAEKYSIRYMQAENKIRDVQIVRVKDHVGYYIVDDDGNRTWYPDNDIGDKPLEGCEFVSIDQAYAFYKDYGKRAGFDVRKGGHYKPKPGEDPNLKWFLCSKEGKNPEPAADKSKDVTSDVSEITTDENVIVKQTRNRGSSRCGCLAKIRIKKFEGNLYRVYTFIEGHNHPLVAEKDMIYMKSSRDLGYTKQHFLFQASNANFGPSTGFRLLKQICGGFDRVGATVVDCMNQKKKMNLFIGDRDAQMVVEKIFSRKLHSPGFYVNYKLGDDDKLVGLFWADEQAIRDYVVFGDIVSFYATFRSNNNAFVCDAVDY
ncbi:FAR1 DNA binding domain, zinc finger, SWIM-type, MULE transposase domain containing protein [Tanacetum coccineum]